MAKRLTDIMLSLAGLAVLAPLLLVAMGAVFAWDGGNPLYRGARVGRGGRDFAMWKLRSMRRDAERLGGSSTALTDARVTPPGRLLRRWKLDELPQLWNVLAGEMSLVGPRPNVRPGGVALYTSEEMRLLTVRPGITDLASIVFADEGRILEGASDADARYDRLIRPWKNRLGLLYVDRHGFSDDLRILGLTALAIVARPLALRGVDAILSRWGADPALRAICRRAAPLPEGRPPGLAA